PALHSQWIGAGTLAMTGAAPSGDLVTVQVNADPGWRATQDGHDIAITQDKLGFVVLHPSPAAATRMELIYRGTIEQRIMAAVSALTWLACLLAWGGRPFRPAPQAFPEPPGPGSPGGADPPGSAFRWENRDLAARRRPDGGVRPTRHA